MPNNVSEIVKKIIIKEDKTVSRVAHRMGIAPQSLNAMLRGSYNVS